MHQTRRTLPPTDWRWLVQNDEDLTVNQGPDKGQDICLDDSRLGPLELGDEGRDDLRDPMAAVSQLEDALAGELTPLPPVLLTVLLQLLATAVGGELNLFQPCDV